MADNTKKKRKPTIAIVLFIAIIVYIICSLVIFFSKKKVDVYEVVKGSVSHSITSTGIIQRTEKLYNSSDSGKIYYYNREGSRIKIGDPLYTLDKVGNLTEVVDKYSKNTNAITDGGKEQLVLMLENYRENYNSVGFAGIYDVSRGIETIKMSAFNNILTGKSAEIKKEMGRNDAFETVLADECGYVSYTSDGLESADTDQLILTLESGTVVTQDDFGDEDTIDKGEHAYRLVQDELWYMYIPLTEELIEDNDLQNTNVISITLKKVNQRVNANFGIVEKNGKNYGEIIVNRYVFDYLSDRYVDIDMNIYESTGLKIPNSSIIKRDMYIIPKKYITTSGNSVDPGVLVSKGSGTEFTNISVSYSDEDNAYVKLDEISEGTVIVDPDSSETYTISEKEKVDGVFGINAGYVVFEPVYVTTRGDEYTIVDEDYSSISIYDRILLNTEGYKENDVVY